MISKVFGGLKAAFGTLEAWFLALEHWVVGLFKHAAPAAASAAAPAAAPTPATAATPAAPATGLLSRLWAVVAKLLSPLCSLIKMVLGGVLKLALTVTFLRYLWGGVLVIFRSHAAAVVLGLAVVACFVWGKLDEVIRTDSIVSHAQAQAEEAKGNATKLAGDLQKANAQAAYYKMQLGICKPASAGASPGTAPMTGPMTGQGQDQSVGQGPAKPVKHRARRRAKPAPGLFG